eukprot:TRINITY_DN42584_c0_g1_i1.p1 TRINITY_DN42584_c0_g1~~TRINITY_DN42584_c0_g1_i1.p1  ORF type:complete len:134 (-),score=17.74 TRINITY_DN42584_c0_g1_i1:183-563(-)
MGKFKAMLAKYWPFRRSCRKIGTISVEANTEVFSSIFIVGRSCPASSISQLDGAPYGSQSAGLHVPESSPNTVQLPHAHDDAADEADSDSTVSSVDTLDDPVRMRCETMLYIPYPEEYMDAAALNR